jgi:hypothetical protein
MKDEQGRGDDEDEKYSTIVPYYSTVVLEYPIIHVERLKPFPQANEFDLIKTSTRVEMRFYLVRPQIGRLIHGVAHQYTWDVGCKWRSALLFMNTYSRESTSL